MVLSSSIQTWVIMNALCGLSSAAQGSFKDRSICVYQDDCAIGQTCCCYECVSGLSCVGCTCDKSSACASGESCCNHLCMSQSNCVGRDCSLDDQCGTNEHCCSHKCASLQSGCSCSSKSDCGDSGDLKCCNKACKHSCKGTLCSTDSDCDHLSCCGGWCTKHNCFNYTPLIIGLVCGSVVIVLLGGFFYCRRRRNRLQVTRQPLIPGNSSGHFAWLFLWIPRQRQENN